MNRKLQKFIAFLLAFLTFFCALPISGSSASVLLRPALADSSDFTVVSNPIVSSTGWIYCMTPDGYAQLTGHENLQAEALSIPALVDGHAVVQLGKNAFSANIQLKRVFIPGTVTGIHPDAFSEQTNLIITGWNGSAGLSFAASKGFTAENLSDLDFFDDIIDLSELNAAQWSLTGNYLRIAAPYDSRIRTGTRLYIPRCSRYKSGLPVTVTVADVQENFTLYRYTELSFPEAVESYREEHAELTPDLSKIVFLSEGFSLAPGLQLQGKGVETFEASYPLNFDVEFEISKGVTYKGGIKLDIDADATVDYSNFTVNELILNVDTTTTVSAEVSGSANETASDTKALLGPKGPQMKQVDVAKVPLVSALGLITVYAKVSLTMSASVGIKLEVTIINTNTVTYRDGETSHTKTSRYSNLDVDIKSELSIMLNLGLGLCIGFGATDFSVDISTFTISFGFKFTVSATISSNFLETEDENGGSQYGDKTLCIDITPALVFKGTFKIGAYLKINDDSKINVGKEFPLFNVEKKIAPLHIESDKGAVPQCTHGCCRVSFHTGCSTVIPDVLLFKGQKVTMPDRPVRDGYTFKGWYTEKELQNKYSFSTKVTEDITLYAAWMNPAGELVVLEPEDEGGAEEYLEWEHMEKGFNVDTGKEYENKQMDYAITGYKGNPRNLAIPSYIDGLPVTTIGLVSTFFGMFNGWVPAFQGCDSLVHVTIPDTVTKINGYCFADCSNLETIQLPSNLEVIREGTFSGCESLKTITIPHGVTRIQRGAFKNCTSLEEVWLPNTLVSIEAEAFQGCENLRFISLPSSVREIGDNAFHNCSSLTEIDLPAGLISLGDAAFYGCSSLQSVVLPINPGIRAFYKCSSLESIEFTDAVTQIGSYAFEYCSSLKEVILPSSVTTIDYMAFAYCSSLERASVWGNIGAQAFSDCAALKNLQLHEGMTIIDDGAFSDCFALSRVTLPESLQEIGSYAFSEANISSLIIPHNVHTIGGYAFDYNKPLQSLYIGSNTTTLTKSIVYGCDETLLTIHTPEGSAADEVFADTEWTVSHLPANAWPVSFILNEGRTDDSHPGYAVAGTKLALPADPTRSNHRFTGWYTDEQCTQRWDVQTDRMPASALILYAGWAYAPTGLEYMVVNTPSGDEEAYITGYTGSSRALVIPAEMDGYPVTGIRTGAIPAGVTKVQLPATVTYLGEAVFFRAASLQEITVDPDSRFTSIDGVLYRGNTLLAYPQAKPSAHYTAAENTNQIAPYAFYGTDALSAVTLTDKVDELPEYAFAHSEALQSVTLPARLETIGAWAFYGCPQLTELEIPASVTTLEESAISFCRLLTCITFAADPQELDPTNFSLCGTADELYIYGPVGAPILTATADAQMLNYNEYAVIYHRDGMPLVAVTERAGEKLSLPPDPDNDTRLFSGWKLHGSDVLWNYEEDLMPAHDIRLEAVMKLPFVYKVTDKGITLLKYTGSDQRILVPMTIDDLPVVSIDPDCFAGTNVECLIGRQDFMVLDSYAYRMGYPFETLKFTVTYHANGGFFVGAKDTYIDHTDGSTFAYGIPYRTGYSFDSWYYDAACTQPFESLIDFDYRDIHLYAGWIKTDETVEDIPFTFRADGEDIIITGYTGTKTSAEIPRTINGHRVTAIDDNAFLNNKVLFELTLPDCLERIGASAFSGSRITAIEFPDSLRVVGDQAFENCQELKEVEFSFIECLDTLGKYAFAGCTALDTIGSFNVPVVPEGCFMGCDSLETLILRPGIISIQSAAFADCTSLKWLTLPITVTFFDPSAVDGCSAMTRFTVTSGNTVYRSANSGLYSLDGTTLVRLPEGFEPDVFTLSDDVLSIGPEALKNTRVQSLVLGNGLLSIGEDALRGAAELESITFAEDSALQRIEANAFTGCRSLTALTFPESLQFIGENAFRKCTLTDVEIPADTVLRKGSIPANPALTIYGINQSPAHLYANENNIRFIGKDLFIEATGITLPKLLHIGRKSNYPLTYWLTPADANSAQITWTSSDDAIVSVSQDGRITAHAYGTARITATLANRASSTCQITVDAYDYDDLPSILFIKTDRIVLSENEPFHLDYWIWKMNDGSERLYCSIENEDLLFCRIDDDDAQILPRAVGSTRIFFYTRNHLTAVVEVVIVEEFPDAPDLTLPAALTHIDAEAFLNTSFGSVRCPDQLESIGSRAFANCRSLRSIYIPASVTFIADDAFENCTDLVIHGENGSYAKTYAKEHSNILFVDW